MKRIALLLAASALVSPALAADVVYEEPAAPMAVMAPVSNWTGLYLGVQGGGAFQPDNGGGLGIASSFGTNTPVPGFTAAANNGFAANTIGAAFGNSFSSEFDSSFIGGAHVGYDYQVGNAVFGVLADINAVDVSYRDSAFSNTPAVYSVERSIDYLATGRLRAGYLVTPTALAYVTGGVAYGDFDYAFRTDSPAVSGNSRSAATSRPATLFTDDDSIGYSVGGGMEVKVTQNISFGAEYLYTDLGDANATARLDGGPFDGTNLNAGGTTGGFTDFTSGGSFDFHTVTAKLSYRFN